MYLSDLVSIFIVIVIPVLLIFAIGYMLWLKHKPFKLKDLDLWKEASKFLMLIYSVYLLYYGLYNGIGYGGYFSYNLVPFHTIFSYTEMLIHDPIMQKTAFWNLLGNVLLTLPFGFFITIMFQKMKWKTIVVSSVLFSISIESGQFILHLLRISSRTIDIDDVILNTLGSILGYVIANKLLALRQNNSRTNESKQIA
ncbi:VanZ family protein [Alkalihalobacillus pseudalcaliphilus]|uniref:VanZ family protein n=1 Tax=Alkalihalobacillus pseudalcaliphilus TaxID=79884 RepID=UPI00069DE9D2|nr:VanZ family protein [Alkalihalobacillus pseudalcaliphilus]